MACPERPGDTQTGAVGGIERDRRVALISMPWAALGSPSLQLGILEGLLAATGARPHVLNLNLHWMDHLVRASDPVQPVLSSTDYELLSQAPGGLAEWVFAAALHGQPADFEAAKYRSWLKERAGREPGLSPREIETLFDLASGLRRFVPAFLARWTESILDLGVDVACFTTTFRQTVPSLALAAALKRAQRRLKIVFGGSGCDGEVGSALIRQFECIDVVVRGEAEPVFADLITDLLDDRCPPPRRGTCVRLPDGRVNAEAIGPVIPTLDRVPVPSFDQYFEDVAGMSFASPLDVVIPIEGVRGCDWGERSKCTFCSHLGSATTYRVKSPERLVEEVLHQCRRHGVLSFSAVDNVISRPSLDALVARIAECGLDLDLYLSSRPDLTRRELHVLRGAGVKAIQGGLESLSTRLLRLMRKGTDALQNIRLLKWAAEEGIHLGWNLICGIPGEDAADYRRMTELIPSLLHLDPPTLTPLEIRRFSEYFEHPESFGIRVLGPDPSYRYLYGATAEHLRDLAFCFEIEKKEVADGGAVHELVAAVEAWRRSSHENAGALRARRGPGFLSIEDRRGGAQAAHHLDAVEAAVYAACDAGNTVEGIEACLQEGFEDVPDRAAIRSFLDELVGLRLAYEEDGRYLSLAVSA